MRSVQLDSALAAFVDASAECLRAELAAGAEIAFELEQQPGRRGAGPALYCYRPLTAEFIAERRGRLQALPEYEPATRLLMSHEGLDRYLVGQGEDLTRLSAEARPRVAIGALLGEVFAEQTDFELHPERLNAALERLQGEGTLAAHCEMTMVATLHGVAISSSELHLTAGLTIAQLDALDGLPPAALQHEPAGLDHLVVVLRSEDPEPSAAVDAGRAVLRDLLRALRLFGDGRVTLGALAWARVGNGRFSTVSLGNGGHPHGMLLVTPEQEDELRAFCNLVSRRAPDGNEIAWALARFEMGCARESPLQSLSDHLLALRALLEPEGASSGLLAGRLAALCATPERRLAMTQRVVAAQQLERAVIAGAATDHAGARMLAGEVSDSLRALLRDVICGHLDADLAGLADELLLAEAAPLHSPAPAAPAPQEPAPVAIAVEPPLGQVAASASAPESVSASQAKLFSDASKAEEILDLFV